MFIAFTSTHLQAQEIEIISYEDKFINSTSPTIITPPISKTKRLNSQNRGHIFFDATLLPDSMKRCIEVATQTWESYLSNTDTIYLQFKLDNLENTVDTKTDVAYFYTKKAPNVYPYCLARHNRLMCGRTSTGYDAIITLNKNNNWDCGFSSEINPNTKNLTSALLRSIATSIGFGSSVGVRSSNNIDFRSHRGYSPFDRLVHSSNKYLDEMQLIDDPNLVSFITSNDLYVLDGKSPEYKLYAPAKFENFNSLQYFENTGALMSYGLKNGEKTLQIDSRTINVIRKIGWEVKEPTSIKIIGDNVPESGITSAYESYKFHIENNTGSSISQPHWTFELPLNSGDIAIVAESSNLTFTIPSISNEELYKKSIDGDINGLITFSGTVNGKRVIQIYNIYLELKPAIFFISEPTITYNKEKRIYYADFIVQYRGADYLHLSIEEDLVPTILNEYVYEPYQAHIHVGPLNDYHEAWIDIQATNNYGKTLQTITLEKISKHLSDPINTWTKKTFKEFDYYDVYDLEGKIVRKKCLEDNIQDLSNGFYLMKCYRENQYIETKKIIK